MKKKIKKHKKLYYLAKVIKNIKNDKFVTSVCKLPNDPEKLEYKSYGVKNKSKNIYFIYLDSKTSGFFAFYKWVLPALAFADSLEFIPVVCYSKNCLYSEKYKINNTDNPFEYYFKQTSNITVDEVYQSKNVFLFNFGHLKWIEEELNSDFNPNAIAGYEFSEKYIKYLSKISQKYIKLNEYTKNKFDRDEKHLFKNNKKKTIGVHIRGTDFIKGFENHPKMIEVEKYIKELKIAFEKSHFGQIFLATDDSNILDKMSKEFGENLLFYPDVYRTSGKESVAFSEDRRKNHHYLNGLEVLRDVYTLSHCEGLMAGLSNVSFAARVFRYSCGYQYEYIKIFDNGIIRK